MWRVSLLNVQASLKRRLGHVFSHGPASKTPAISFDSFLTMPECLPIGKSSTVLFLIQHRDQIHTKHSKPILVSQSLICSLRSSVHLTLVEFDFDCEITFKGAGRQRKYDHDA